MVAAKNAKQLGLIARNFVNMNFPAVFAVTCH